MFSAFAVLAVLLAAPVFSADKDAGNEKDLLKGLKCPVSGKAVVAKYTADYKGKDVHFCCPNCPKAFTKNPEKFAAKAVHQLLATKQITQVACPYTGEKLNPKTAVDVAGVKVSFCCKNCQKKTLAVKGDERLKMVFAKFDKGFTLQTKCPVSGKAIDASKVTEYKGKKVYFCCPNCSKAFTKNPEKFTSKIPQLNVT